MEEKLLLWKDVTAFSVPLELLAGLWACLFFSSTGVWLEVVLRPQKEALINCWYCRSSVSPALCDNKLCVLASVENLYVATLWARVLTCLGGGGDLSGINGTTLTRFFVGCKWFSLCSAIWAWFWLLYYFCGRQMWCHCLTWSRV